MQISKISSVDNQNFSSNLTKAGKQNENSKQIKNGDKLLAIGATAVAAIGIASVAILKGKTKALEDINFNKGIATLKKNGEQFSGKIKTKLSNGDNVILEYSNGVLQKSTRTGLKNVSKTYSVNAAGEKIVETLEDGKVDIKNITEISNFAKKEQAKLTELLEDNKKLSYEEASDTFRNIKHKNSKQKAEIENILDAKWEHKKEIKAEAQRRENAKTRIECARYKEDSYFEALSKPSKSARESMEVFEEYAQDGYTDNLSIMQSQTKYNKDFEDKLSHKSAEDSAKVFEMRERIEESFARIQGKRP